MPKYKLTEEDEANIASNQSKSKPHMLSNIALNLKCKTEGQKLLVNSIKTNEVTICSGLAGTGKTYLACYQALKLLKAYPGKYKQIILVKSVTTLKDEEIGFLKGGMEDKMEPFIYSFIHNIQKIIGPSLTETLKTNKTIDVLPIAYMRGINLDNSIVIIDEAQNLTQDHIVTILTRLGHDSRMIFLGDRDQIDRKSKRSSGLEWMIKTFKDFEKVGTISLGVSDVVRNKLVGKILAHLEQLK